MFDRDVPARRPSTQSEPKSAFAEKSSADAEILIRKAHRVLLHYMPGASLPAELSRVRALLDVHMFGRDKRGARDDLVEVARQIDRTLPRIQT